MPVLDYINKNNSHIKSINVYDFENLFGSIPHSNIVKVCSDIYVYDDFSSILNCDKSFWINLVKFCIFENVFIIVKIIFYRLKAYLWVAHFLVLLLIFSYSANSYITKQIF